MSFYIKRKVTIRLKLWNYGISGYHSNVLSNAKKLHERNLQYVGHERPSSPLLQQAYRVCSENTW